MSAMALPELIPEVIDWHAQRAPDRDAVRMLDQSMSYAELAERSDGLAAALGGLGVKRHDRVGIYMNKRLETPVALYGIMKAGAAYVPLDPGAPAERIATILRQCGIRTLVTDGGRRRSLKQVLNHFDGLDHAIGIDSGSDLGIDTVGWDELDGLSRVPRRFKLLGQDLAYIIYTSGSTGTPKGIMHTHDSGLSFANWAAREYGLHEHDRLSNHAPLHFDLSIFDYFAGAVAGAATTIVPEDYLRLPPSYSQYLDDQGITVLFTVPFALIQLLLHGALDQRDLGTLRWVIFGGEPMPVQHLHALMERLPNAAFDNMYGPAEVNGCTHHTVKKLQGTETSIPIGPINSISEALIVDQADQPVPQGEIGELLVRTPTMMQGYWGQPELNAAAFHRLADIGGWNRVYYRTGDLVVERPDGVLLFVGRKDRQVKVRGYRIELDEIESVLTANQHVEEAAAYPMAQHDGSQQIWAEVTLKHNGQTSVDDLLQHAGTRLPPYAMPARLSVRDQFPRTTTGKIDRRALREQATVSTSR